MTYGTFLKQETPTETVIKLGLSEDLGLELGVTGEKTVREALRPHLYKIVKMAEFIFRPTAHSPFSSDHLPPSFQCPNILPACSSFNSQACPAWTASKILDLIFYAYAYSNLHLVSSQPIIKEQKLETDSSLKKIQEWQMHEQVIINIISHSVQFSSIAQLCLTLCNPMDGFPVHWQFLELVQTHWVGDAFQPSHILLHFSPPALNLSQHQGLFQWISSSQQVAKVL